MSTTIEINCGNCSNIFYCQKKEYTRQIKNNRTIFFCGLSCARVYGNKNMNKETRAKITENIKKINQGNQYGKKGKFTFYLNKARNRHKNFDLDELFLNSIWNGKCALSNISIFLKDKLPNNLTTASLDRIDSSQGYIKGNVQFVAYGLNLAKNKFKDDEIIRLINEIKKN
jgi:hypothetical protein